MVKTVTITPVPLLQPGPVFLLVLEPRRQKYGRVHKEFKEWLALRREGFLLPVAPTVQKVKELVSSKTIPKFEPMTPVRWPAAPVYVRLPASELVLPRRRR